MSTNIPKIQERMKDYSIFIKEVKPEYWQTKYFSIRPNVKKKMIAEDLWCYQICHVGFAEAADAEKLDASGENV